jgi:hypothetical protein
LGALFDIAGDLWGEMSLAGGLGWGPGDLWGEMSLTGGLGWGLGDLWGEMSLAGGLSWAASDAVKAAEPDSDGWTAKSVEEVSALIREWRGDAGRTSKPIREVLQGLGAGEGTWRVASRGARRQWSRLL